MYATQSFPCKYVHYTVISTPPKPFPASMYTVQEYVRHPILSLQVCSLYSNMHATQTFPCKYVHYTVICTPPN